MFNNLAATLFFLYFTKTCNAYAINFALSKYELQIVESEYALNAILLITILCAIPAWCQMNLSYRSENIPNYLFIIEYFVSCPIISFLWVRFLYTHFNIVIVFGLFCYFLNTSYVISKIWTSYMRVGLEPLLTDDYSVYRALTSHNRLMGIIAAFASVSHFCGIYLWWDEDKWFCALFTVIFVFTLINLTLYTIEIDFNLRSLGIACSLLFSLIFYGYLISRLHATDRNYNYHLIVVLVAGFHHLVYLRYERIFMIMTYPAFLYIIRGVLFYPWLN